VGRRSFCYHLPPASSGQGPTTLAPSHRRQAGVQFFKDPNQTVRQISFSRWTHRRRPIWKGHVVSFLPPLGSSLCHWRASMAAPQLSLPTEPRPATSPPSSPSTGLSHDDVCVLVQQIADLRVAGRSHSSIVDQPCTKELAATSGKIAVDVIFYGADRAIGTRPLDYGAQRLLARARGQPIRELRVVLLTCGFYPCSAGRSDDQVCCS
jgi:hypothetical protein